MALLIIIPRTYCLTHVSDSYDLDRRSFDLLIQTELRVEFKARFWAFGNSNLPNLLKDGVPTHARAL